MGCFGQAFDRMNYQLVRDISIRILELSENGELLRLQQQWLPYYDSDCSKYSDQSATRKLEVQHFWGLFVIAGLVSAIVLLFYTVQRKWNSSIVVSPLPPPPERSSVRNPPPTRPPPECSSGPTPLREGSSGQGGGFIPGYDYGGSLELMKKIQNMRREQLLINAIPFVGT